jgi:glycerol-3-phosphate dehydrogenase
MQRDLQIRKLETNHEWDLVIIGGGASGLGTAVDSAARGYRTALFEAIDFAKGTSSRSTKLVHGGVRYLANGDIKLVKEALEERGLLAKSARHLFRNQIFVIPVYSWLSHVFYALGLKIYAMLSKKKTLGRSKFIGKNRTLNYLPTLNPDNLVGGVTYHDGKFDDARLAVNLAQTAVDLGATVINYCKVHDLIKGPSGKLCGVEVTDMETQRTFSLRAKAVVNATGVFTNKILKLNGRKKHGLKVVPSQGIHLVLDRSFLPGDHALMIPKTSDGRVLFAIPWHGKVLVGTTDTPIEKAKVEPLALKSEIDFILENLKHHLTKAPDRRDVLSVFAGLRPLVAPEGDKKNTKEISRGHKIMVSETGLVTIMGGKWTTYRKMGETVLDTVIEVNGWPEVNSPTKNLEIHGNMGDSEALDYGHLQVYGSDAPYIETLLSQNPDYRKKIHARYNFTIAEVVWSIRNEMARTVEDILARRVRLLFLDARAAIEATPIVADILARETGRSHEWASSQEFEFIKLAQNYILN